MRYKRHETLGLWLVGFVALGGCASPQIGSQLPQPRPLGRDLATFQAPERPAEQAPPEREDPTGDLTLRDALALALMQNPRLAAFSWEVRAHEAQALQAGLRPNPEFALEVENFAGAGDFRRFDGSETTVTLSQLLELGGKRSKRRSVARLERDLAAWDYETGRIDVLTDVTKAFVAVLAAQERVSLAEELIRVADQVLESVARRVQAGAVSPVEETRARVELATSRVERETAVRELTAARKRLAATWASSSPSFSRASGDLERTATPPPLEALVQRIDKNPDLARWDTELEAQGAVVALEKAHRVPDVNLGAGIRHISEVGDNAFVLEVAIPLPLFDRNQGAARAAEHRLARAQAERRAAGVQIRTELAAVYEDLAAAFDQVVALRGEILPEAQRASSTAHDAYLRGLFRFTDVLDTQRTLFELRGRYFSALARYHSAVADVERLIAEGLEGLPRDEDDGRP